MRSFGAAGAWGCFFEDGVGSKGSKGLYVGLLDYRCEALNGKMKSHLMPYHAMPSCLAASCSKITLIHSPKHPLPRLSTATLPGRLIHHVLDSPPLDGLCFPLRLERIDLGDHLGVRDDLFDLEGGAVERVVRVREEVGTDGGAVDGGARSGENDGVRHEGEHEGICIWIISTQAYLGVEKGRE